MRAHLLVTVAAFLMLAPFARCYAGESGGADSDATVREKVVLLHGLGRSKTSMWFLALRIEKAGFDVTRVGYDSLRDPPKTILADVARQIDQCCAAPRTPVHLVGHSLGGLMIRAYLAQRRLPNLGRVVLIGTPNNGTPIVDALGESWWLNLAGPTARTLGTGAESFPGSLPDPDYPVGVIAGFRDTGFASDFIPGDDDGLVPVESTKLPGMTDFVVVESGHSFMRYNDQVVRQTVAFLRDGRFIHER